MTEVWMGYMTAARAKKDDRLLLTGSRQLEKNFETWLGSNRFAKMQKCVA